MTSTTDEITNLRAALDHIRAWCAHEVKNGNPSPEAQGVYDTVRAMAMRGLKTQRASKITEPDTLRLDKLIDCMVPTFLQNDGGWVCLCEDGEPLESQPMSNFRHWPTARDAIDHMGERTVP